MLKVLSKCIWECVVQHELCPWRFEEHFENVMYVRFISLLLSEELKDFVHIFWVLMIMIVVPLVVSNHLHVSCTHRCSWPGVWYAGDLLARCRQTQWDSRFDSANGYFNEESTETHCYSVTFSIDLRDGNNDGTFYRTPVDIAPMWTARICLYVIVVPGKALQWFTSFHLTSPSTRNDLATSRPLLLRRLCRKVRRATLAKKHLCAQNRKYICTWWIMRALHCKPYGSFLAILWFLFLLSAETALGFYFYLCLLVRKIAMRYNKDIAAAHVKGIPIVFKW